MATEVPTVTACEAAPPSLQALKRYWVPAAPSWGVATAMLWVPCGKFKICGAFCDAPPSTLNCNPEGLVSIVTGVWFALAGATNSAKNTSMRLAQSAPGPKVPIQSLLNSTQRPSRLTCGPTKYSGQPVGA